MNGAKALSHSSATRLAGERHAGVRQQADAERAEEREHADVGVPFVHRGDADPARPAGREVEVGFPELPGLEHQADHRRRRKPCDHVARDRPQVPRVGEDVAAREDVRIDRAAEGDAIGDARALREPQRRGHGVFVGAVAPGVLPDGAHAGRAGHRGDHRRAGIGAGRRLRHHVEAGQVELQIRDPAANAVQHRRLALAIGVLSRNEGALQSCQGRVGHGAPRDGAGVQGVPERRDHAILLVVGHLGEERKKDHVVARRPGSRAGRAAAPRRRRPAPDGRT